MDEPKEFTESGNPILRHGQPKNFEMAAGDSENIEQISQHITKHIGEPATVFHEILSHLVHIDVHVVAPTEARPFYTLVTSGMSDKPMAVPEGCEELRHAELMLCLPPDWPMEQESWKDENNFWPIKTLKFLARMPHEYETWLGPDHTVPNGDPPDPFGNSKLCCAFIGLPDTASEEFVELKINDEKTILFYAVFFIYKEEMELKMKKGAEELWKRFAENQITELLDINRKNVAKKLFGIF